jgi:hypothetical protein
VAIAENNLLGEGLWDGAALSEDYQDWGFDRTDSSHKVNRWYARQIPGLFGRKVAQEQLQATEKRQMGPVSASASGLGTMRVAAGNVVGLTMRLSATL